MGCTQSTAEVSAVAPEASAPAAADKAKASEKPQPMIFAIMRNGHEVIRGCQKDLKALIEAGDIDGAAALWERHNKWMLMHMTMEEGNGSDGSPKGLFKLLNEKFENVAGEAGLSAMHDDLQVKEQAVQDAMTAKDIDALKAAFPAYDELNLTHLQKEEAIMMPKVMEMKKMGLPVKKLMIEECMALIVDSEDLEFFIKFANEILEKHAEGQPRARVFNHALWAVATEEQWTVWDAWIKETLKPETYKELHDIISPESVVTMEKSS